MTKKQPIIFENNQNKNFVEGEQTMDMLLHYAQSGIAEAERAMREQPDLFSEREIMDFAANKVVLAKAPDILSDYKKKVEEFERMHEKVQSVVGKCQKIVRNHEIRKAHDHDSFVDPHQKKQKVHKKPAAGVIRYTDDGQVLMGGDPFSIEPRKKIVIELPKHGKY
ncbi:MAG: hypothetical protein KDF58_09370 [Alphaproteobacteria bacterium]|nr:hypothetical protein [Alphaproteobacteria bacterium]HRW29788.1 hypothetical protein [Emcibacteraceae bacterium]